MRILAISPHTDDVELGCGGYLNKLYEEGNEILMVTFSVEFQGQNLMDEWEESAGVVGATKEHSDYKVREFDKSRQPILQDMIDLKELYRPDLVLIPSRSDTHQDHEVIHAEAVRAFSTSYSVLAYELPWNTREFKPNYFVELSTAHLDGKIRMLSCYRSQLWRKYFNRDFIESVARMRGVQIWKEFAEAFEVITWIS